DRAVSPETGLLYAANTLGAVAGTLATPFVLVPAFGITGTVLAASALQLAAATAAFAMDRTVDSPSAPAVPSRRAASHDATLPLTLYGAAGAIAMGYEVIWSELLVQFLSTRAYAFAVMLATYLAGLAIGSYVWAPRERSRANAWRSFGLLIAGAGASALLIVALLGGWITGAQTLAGMWAMRLTGRETVEVSARFAVAAVSVLLVPTMLLGAAFPVIARLTAGAASVGSAIGLTLAVNTLGGVVGTLVVGVVLVPSLGLVHSLGLLAVAAAVIGAIAFRRSGGSLAVAGAMVVVAAVMAAS